MNDISSLIDYFFDLNSERLFALLNMNDTFPLSWHTPSAAENSPRGKVLQMCFPRRRFSSISATVED